MLRAFDSQKGNTMKIWARTWERWSWWWWNRLLPSYAVAMNCDAAQKYYYILIVVAVISWMDENNFHIIENNLNALFTSAEKVSVLSNRSKIPFAHVRELWLQRKFLLTFLVFMTQSDWRPLCVSVIEGSKEHDKSPTGRKMQSERKSNEKIRLENQEAKSHLFFTIFLWESLLVR